MVKLIYQGVLLGVKSFFVFLLFASCQLVKPVKLDPYCIQLHQNDIDWEYLYSIELKNALDNEDDMAFHFFWPLYLEARYENKIKKLDRIK